MRNLEGFSLCDDDPAERKNETEAEKIFETFHSLVTGELKDVSFETLGKLGAFGGVSEFPARVKCASLAWHTMHNALDAKTDLVSTEITEKSEGGSTMGEVIAEVQVNPIEVVSISARAAQEIRKIKSR